MNKAKLSNRFSLWVLLSVLLLGTILSVFNLYTNYQSSMAAIDLAVQSHLRETEAIASEAIYKLDKPISQSLVNGSTANRYIVRSELYSDDGELLAVNVKPADPNIWRPLSTPNRIVEHPIVITELGSSNFGKHLVEIDYEAGMANFYQQALTDAIVDFLLISLVSLVIYLITLFYIARPVARLATEVSNINLGQLPTSEYLTDRTDELGSLARSTYSYIRRAHQYARDIQNQQLQRLELEEQLRHSQKMDAIGQLAGGIAHDFNNIMTVILGNANLAQTYLETGATDNIKRSLEAIIQSGERASKLTKQLLVFSRKDLSEPTAVKLNVLINQSIKMLERLITEDMTISYELKNCQPIFADENQIDLILINLTVNAKDAMPDGGQLVIRCSDAPQDDIFLNRHPDYKGGDYVLFSLTDQGVGIEESVLNRVFDPFFTTKPIGKGTGLGLSTVYGIVSSCEGIIDIESKPGRGTTVKIYFPAVTDAKPATRQIVEETEDGSDLNADVLICEDDDSVRNYLVDLLATTPLKITALSNPVEALEHYHSNSNYDLLITDIIMPDMNGKELSDRMNDIKPIKSIFVSGYSENVITERGIITEHITYLQKPFNQNRLFAAIREQLHAD